MSKRKTSPPLPPQNIPIGIQVVRKISLLKWQGKDSHVKRATILNNRIQRFWKSEFAMCLTLCFANESPAMLRCLSKAVLWLCFHDDLHVFWMCAFQIFQSFYLNSNESVHLSQEIFVTLFQSIVHATPCLLFIYFPLPNYIILG